MSFYAHKTNHTYAAKETTYRGTTFRSKLEARWVVLFDELGLQWEYEPRPFRTPFGGYLPDFLILGTQQRHPFWIEIKGPEPIERDYARAEEVQKQTGQKLRFLVGPVPARGEAGTIQTRIFVRGKWRPARWTPPGAAGRLDTALHKASAFDFGESLL